MCQLLQQAEELIDALVAGRAQSLQQSGVDEVARLIGRPALTFANWTRDSAGEFR